MVFKIPIEACSFLRVKKMRWIFVLVFSIVCSSGLSAQQLVRNSRAESLKGLQVQMLDDALELGIRQAALNFNFGELIAPEGIGSESEEFIQWQRGSEKFAFRRSYVVQQDRLIAGLSESEVIVSLILLNYLPADPVKRRLLVHPSYSEQCPNQLSAFNTETEEGRKWLGAAVEFLAERWGGESETVGRVRNWIVGNEVNSHWYWSNCGRVTMEEFTDDYLEAVRLIHQSVRKHSAEGQVFVSLEHHWNIRYAGGDERQAFAARPFLENFAARAREVGDFDWQVAFHPYPENLFEPRTWRDRSAKADWRTTPRITFRNLEVLLDFLGQPELQFQGETRRVILSEQGFHTPDGPEGEQLQAAAYCYAWHKVQSLDGIDAFILHRHVDHAQEGGLRLGLWTRREGSIADPEKKKMIYEVFRAAGTAEQEEAFRFALPIIGIEDWSAVRMSEEKKK
jgi:hypothetical protein